MSEILQRVRECDDPEEKKRIVEEYNRRRSEVETDSVQGTSEDEENNSIYDARNDVEWIIKRASNYGLHFLFCFDQGRDFINLRLDENAFATKSFSLCPKMNLFPSWVAVRQMRLVTGHAFTAMVRTPSLSGLIFIVVFLAMAGRLMTMAT